MPVSSVRRDLPVSKYTIIRDCIAGQDAVKRKGTTYLPQPNASDTSEANHDRYNAYLERAVFYNVVKRTLTGLVGQVYSRDPEIKLPDELAFLKDNADGAGIDLVQLSKMACDLVIAYGRAGLFIDHPETGETGTSAAELETGSIRPVIKLYDPLDIINWRTIERGRETILSLVVLREQYEKTDDGFMVTSGNQYRVLRLDNTGQYYVQVYRDDNLNFPFESFTPTDRTGKRFDTIPFTFIGSSNNDSIPDEPPMYDIAVLNIGHYRNSADYEESAFIVGQPTPYFTGLTTSWVKEILKDKIQLGSRAAVPLPVGGTAGLLQPSPNSMPKEAMDHKERQMVALGAQLVQETQVQRTATEAEFEHSGEMSTLSASADNVSSAFLFAITVCGKFVGIDIPTDPVPVPFVLNTEFDLVKLSPEERRQLVEEWVAGAISWPEYRSNLKRGGIASEDDAKAQQEILADPIKKQKQEQATKQAQQQPPTNSE